MQRRFYVTAHVLAAVVTWSGCAMSRRPDQDGRNAGPGREALDVVAADLDGDGLDDIVVKLETHQDVRLIVLLAPGFDEVSSLRFGTGSSIAEDAFCGVRVEMTVERSAEAGRGAATIRLSDGMCDAFFIEWDQSKRRLRWSRL